MTLPPEVREILEGQGYRLVGGHSAVKLCHWLKQGLQDQPGCYKQRFYGIDSHRCLQMTPAVAVCNQKCLFCWRSYEHWSETQLNNHDPSKELLEGVVSAQRQLLTGFKGSPEKYDLELVEEAMNPRHLAISLSGEPTLYPELSSLIQKAHNRGMTTFLVTNGQQPRTIRDIEQPTQLYVSLDAPDKKIYNELCRPLEGGWQNLNRTLEHLPGHRGRTALRITLVKGINDNPDGYTQLIQKAKPDFIEVKAYMHVGYSRKRLERKRMPSNDEVKAFAEKLSDKTDYSLDKHVIESRVTLLTSDKEPQIKLERENNIE